MCCSSSPEEVLEALTDAAEASALPDPDLHRALASAVEVFVPRIAELCVVRRRKDGGLEVLASKPRESPIDLRALARAESECQREGAARVDCVEGRAALVAPLRWGTGAGVLTLVSRTQPYGRWSAQLVRAVASTFDRIAERASLQSDLEHQRDRLRLLGDICHACSGALSMEDIAGVVARGLGVAASVVLLNHDGSSTLGAFADADPAIEARMRTMQGHPLRNERMEPGTIFHRIMSGQPYFRPGPGVLDDLQPVWAAFVRRLGGDAMGKPLLGCIAAPLRIEGRIIGLLAVARHGRAPSFEEDDVDLVMQIAERASVAIDRARLWESQVRLFEREQAAMASRDDFLACACHELNTPLTALTLQLQSMQRQGRVDPNKVDAATRQVGRLNKLVGELLDVAHLRDDRVRLEPETFDLAALVHEVVHRFAAELARSGSALSLDVRGPCIGAWDRMRVEQAFAGIYSNAIKYGQGGPIDVVLSLDDACPAPDGRRRDEDVVRLVVRDRGIGIARGDQERIFERFERVAPKDHYSGLGLGLWTARRVIEASGGRVFVESSAGSGSTFTIELRAQRVEPRDSPASAASHAG
jgi:signal transduction histidine kinase